ncbi:MAG: STAS domain-containing protein [Bdellovibrionota bacterium]
MEARLRKDGDINIIHIFGHLSYEVVDRFNAVCAQLLDEKVVFNFDGLSFVGSSGITSFFSAIENLAKRSSVRPKVCCMGLEFRKCISNLIGNSFDYYDSEFMALKSFSVKNVFSEDMVGSSYQKPMQMTGTEEPIGRAYPTGTTLDARPDKVNYPRFSGFGVANTED